MQQISWKCPVQSCKKKKPYTTKAGYNKHLKQYHPTTYDETVNKKKIRKSITNTKQDDEQVK
jgi:hypothetical protein